MPKPPHPARARDALSVKIGSWFEAQATGWGIVAVPILVAALAALLVVQLLGGPA